MSTGLSRGGSLAIILYCVSPKFVLSMIHILQIPNIIRNDDLTPDQKAVLTALALVKGETSVTVNGEPLDETLTEAQIPDYKYYVVYSEDEINSIRDNGLTENFAAATSMFMGLKYNR